MKYKKPTETKRQSLLSKLVAVLKPKSAKKAEKPMPELATIIYDISPKTQESDTQPRDTMMIQAKQVLLGLDHTKARPN